MITRRLSDFVANRSAGEIPDEVIAAATDALIDTLGVAIAGSREPVAEIAVAWVAEVGARAQATVWGRQLATHTADAAFANGISAHALDFDDTHPSGRGHMSASLIPTALAVGEATGASGREVLAAYAIGLEVGGAIGRAFGPGHFLRGWHPTATVGALASTAVAARLHRLDSDGAMRAFGIAASQVGGLARNFGTMAKPFHAGHAARTGIISAWMARAGLTTDGEIFDGKCGVIDTYAGGDGEPIEAVLATLGEPWEILSPGNYYKRWPCCYSGHRTLGALYAMIDKRGISAGNVEEVAVSFLPGGDTALFSRNPETGLEAKFSIEYMVAAALLDGPLRMATFSDEMVRRPEARRLMQRVRRIAIPDNKSYSGIAGYNDIAVTTASDRVEIREDRVPGSRAWPTSEADRDAKFMDCATPVLGEAGARTLLDRARACGDAGDVRSLIKATLPAT